MDGQGADRSDGLSARASIANDPNRCPPEGRFSLFSMTECDPAARHLDGRRAPVIVAGRGSAAQRREDWDRTVQT
jgi:hypothetical protein